MMLADLHVHSTFSDGQLTVSELVDFYGSRGFGCIAITDHLCEESTFLGKTAAYLNRTLTPTTFPLYRSTLSIEAERAWDQYKMVLLPGVEFTKNSLAHNRSSHILGIGIDEFISADGDVVALCRAVRSLGGITVAAHPVSTRRLEPQTYYLWSRRDELRAEIDAWEVASGAYLFEEVQKSGLPMVASSDFHRPRQINSFKTVFNCERNPEAILDAIRSQELSFQFYREAQLNPVPRFLGASFVRV
jgi:predicted metal-dependent phosphoesterase TrpH